MSVPAFEARARTLAGGAVLLDIRERYEADLARVREAVHLPLGMLLAEPERARSGKPIFVLDHEGSRAPFAARYLRDNGHDAIAVEGGALAYLGAKRA